MEGGYAHGAQGKGPTQTCMFEDVSGTCFSERTFQIHALSRFTRQPCSQFSPGLTVRFSQKQLALSNCNTNLKCLNCSTQVHKGGGVIIQIGALNCPYKPVFLFALMCTLCGASSLCWQFFCFESIIIRCFQNNFLSTDCHSNENLIFGG